MQEIGHATKEKYESYPQDDRERNFKTIPMWEV